MKPKKAKIPPGTPIVGSIFDHIDVNRPEYEPLETPAEWVDAAWRAFHRGREYLANGGGNIGTLAIGAIGNPETLCATIKSLQEILSREMPNADELSVTDIEKITPEQAAILSIDTAVWMLAYEIESKQYTARTVSNALGIGAALMRLAIENPKSKLSAEIMAVLCGELPKIREAAKEGGREGGRHGAKGGVKEVFRERDNKTRKTKGEKSQYSMEVLETAFSAVDAMMKAKAGRGRIGETLKSVYGSKHLHKITFERFRRAYYKSRSGK